MTVPVPKGMGTLPASSLFGVSFRCGHGLLTEMAIAGAARRQPSLPRHRCSGAITLRPRRTRDREPRSVRTGTSSDHAVRRLRDIRIIPAVSGAPAPSAAATSWTWSRDRQRSAHRARRRICARRKCGARTSARTSYRPLVQAGSTRTSPRSAICVHHFHHFHGAAALYRPARPRSGSGGLTSSWRSSRAGNPATARGTAPWLTRLRRPGTQRPSRRIRHSVRTRRPRPRSRTPTAITPHGPSRPRHASTWTGYSPPPPSRPPRDTAGRSGDPQCKRPLWPDVCAAALGEKGGRAVLGGAADGESSGICPSAPAAWHRSSTATPSWPAVS
jgi:hypothetical protein